jgi:hypothetical protein
MSRLVPSPNGSAAHRSTPSAPIPIPRTNTRMGDAPARRSLSFQAECSAVRMSAAMDAAQSYPVALETETQPTYMPASPPLQSSLPRPTPCHVFVKAHSWAGGPTDTEAAPTPAPTPVLSNDANGHAMAGCVFPRTILRSTSPVFPAFSLNASEQDSGSDSPCLTGDELESDAVNSTAPTSTASRVPESSSRKRPSDHPQSASRLSGLRKMSTTLFPERTAPVTVGETTVTEYEPDLSRSRATLAHPVHYGRPLVMSRHTGRSHSHSADSRERDHEWDTMSEAENTCAQSLSHQRHEHSDASNACATFAPGSAPTPMHGSSDACSRPAAAKQPPGRPLRTHARQASYGDEEVASDSELVMAPTRTRAAPKPSSIARVLRNHRGVHCALLLTSVYRSGARARVIDCPRTMHLLTPALRSVPPDLCSSCVQTLFRDASTARCPDATSATRAAGTHSVCWHDFMSFFLAYLLCTCCQEASPLTLAAASAITYARPHMRALHIRSSRCASSTRHWR